MRNRCGEGGSDIRTVIPQRWALWEARVPPSYELVVGVAEVRVWLVAILPEAPRAQVGLERESTDSLRQPFHPRVRGVARKCVAH